MAERKLKGRAMISFFRQQIDCGPTSRAHNNLFFYLFFTKKQKGKSFFFSQKDETSPWGEISARDESASWRDFRELWRHDRTTAGATLKRRWGFMGSRVTYPPRALSLCYGNLSNEYWEFCQMKAINHVSKVDLKPIVKEISILQARLQQKFFEGLNWKPNPRRALRRQIKSQCVSIPIAWKKCFPSRKWNNQFNPLHKKLVKFFIK